MKLIEQDGLAWVEFERWAALEGVAHGILTRLGGVSVRPYESLNMSSYRPDDPAAVAENQRRGYGVFGRTAETLVHAHLQHGNNVVRVDQSHHGQVIPDCDGLITNDPGCGLTMNYADCGSIFLYDRVTHAIGLGHAGWRGAVANVAGRMVAAMQREFGSACANIMAGLGPCISASYYEVGEPVISEVERLFPKWVDRLLSYPVDEAGERVGRPYFNLALANHIGLYEADVKDVELPTFCTAARTDLFFSHRAEHGETGRFAAVLTLD